MHGESRKVGDRWPQAEPVDRRWPRYPHHTGDSVEAAAFDVAS